MTSDVSWIEKPSSQLTSALQSKIVLRSKGSSIQVAMHCESLVMSNILGGNGREVKQQIHTAEKSHLFLKQVGKREQETAPNFYIELQGGQADKGEKQIALGLAQQHQTYACLFESCCQLRMKEV